VGFLEDIVAQTRGDVARRKMEHSLDDLLARIDPPDRGRPFSEALIAPGVSLIAEMKRASPSRGPIRPDADVTSIVRAYEQGGAAACSILTEPQFFGGSLDDLRAARAACTLPLLRKDFIVDCYQLAEARLAGADAALLIVAALEEAEFAELLHFGGELGLDLLVEAHTEDEVQAAVDGGAEIVGINNRNLKTLEVDPDTVLNLLADIPAGTVVVAESGISERADVIRLGEAGVDAILVGEALMREDDPAAAIRSLIGTT
jgi:indole-3-glycerol phosphate synthase